MTTVCMSARAFLLVSSTGVPSSLRGNTICVFPPSDTTFQHDDPRRDPRTHLVGVPPVWLMSSLGRKPKRGGSQKQPNTQPPRVRVCVVCKQYPQDGCPKSIESVSNIHSCSEEHPKVLQTPSSGDDTMHMVI